MHRNVLLSVTALAYYALAAAGLFIFEAGILVSSIVLFGIPAYLLARFSAAPSVVITAVIVLGGGIAVLLEGIAHMYGIWYTLGVDELRLFGLIPVEVLFTSIVQTLFLALLYELIFDDGVYTSSSARIRFAAFGVFALSVLALIGLHQYVVQGVFLSHSYVWILCILVASSFAALAVHKRLSTKFFKRLTLFSLLAAIPLCISAVLAVTNTHKVFAYVHDYLYVFSIFGEIIPLEELLMIFILPLFVATFYELYLDDAK